MLQSKKLEAEVLAPMNRWTTAFSTVEVSVATLLSSLRVDMPGVCLSVNMPSGQSPPRFLLWPQQAHKPPDKITMLAKRGW